MQKHDNEGDLKNDCSTWVCGDEHGAAKCVSFTDDDV